MWSFNASEMDTFCSQNKKITPEPNAPALLLPLILAVMLLLAALTGCGYHNPYAAGAAGPARNLHVAMWDNPSNVLGLESVFQRSLAGWFLQSKNIALTDTPAGAEYILSGAILSARFPGLTYGLHDRAEELRAVLTVWVSLKEASSGEPLWEEPGLTLEESFAVGEDAVSTQRNREKALAKIAERLAEELYFRTQAAIFAP